MKLDHDRDEALIKVREAIIFFIKENYVKRKLDFTTEVYAPLEKSESVRAKETWTTLKIYGRGRKRNSSCGWGRLWRRMRKSSGNVHR
jgi:hypothetical protein